MTSKNSAFFSSLPLSFMWVLLLVLVGATEPLLAQRGSGGGRVPRSGPPVGESMSGHGRHFGGHFDGHFGGRRFGGHPSFSAFGGPRFSFSLGFHDDDFTFVFGGRDHLIGSPFTDHRAHWDLGFGGPHHGRSLGYALYSGAYAYGAPAYGYDSRGGYPIRPVFESGDNVGAESAIPDHLNDSARLDLRAEPARLVLSIPPTRAHVYLDGQLIGIAAELRHREGFLIDAGEHRLETVHPTFENRTFEFSAAPGETIELE